MPLEIDVSADGSIYFNGECIINKGVPVPENRKRVLSERDPNIQLPPQKRIATKPRKPRTDIRETFGSEPCVNYICIARPKWASKKRKGEKEVAPGTKLYEVLLVKQNWNYFMTGQTLLLLNEHRRLVEFCNPKDFDMEFGKMGHDRFSCMKFDTVGVDGAAVSEDFFGNGVVQIIEKLIQTFHTATTGGRSLNFRKMFSAIAALAHFLNDFDLHSDVWMRISDPFPMQTYREGANRVQALSSLIGCAILTALNWVERLEQLKDNSIIGFTDLGLVMALFMRWSRRAPRTTFGEVDWQAALKGYAIKAGIDLTAQGVADLPKKFVAGIDAGGIEGKATATRWEWTKNLADYRDKHAETSLGKWYSHFNILEMDRYKRTQRNINGRDPLTHYNGKEIKMVLKGEWELERICITECAYCEKTRVDTEAWMAQHFPNRGA